MSNNTPTRQQPVTLNRDVLRALRPSGRFQSIADARVRGLSVKVTPKGRISYTYRYQKPNGTAGRKTLGYWPTMQPDDARARVAELEQTLELKRDPAAVRSKKRDNRKDAERQANFMTGREFIKDHFESHLKTTTKTGDERIKELCQSFTAELALPLVDIDQKCIEKWRTAALETGLSPSTVNRKVATLRGMLSRAVDWEFIDRNPLAKLKNLREPEGRVRYLSDDENRRLEAAFDERDERKRQHREMANAGRRALHRPEYPDLRAVHYVDRLRPMVKVARKTGLRWQEEAGLEWRDVDFQRRQIHVRAEICKTGRGRYIPLSDEVFETLTLWRQQSTGSKFVFPNDEGTGPIGSVRKAWLTLLKAAQIEDFNWHDLRHDFASRAVMAGVSITVVGRWLGHTTALMTERYVHLAPDYQAQTAKLIDA